MKTSMGLWTCLPVVVHNLNVKFWRHKQELFWFDEKVIKEYIIITDDDLYPKQIHRILTEIYNMTQHNIL